MSTLAGADAVTVALLGLVAVALAFALLRRRLLRAVGTTMSLQPATPAAFPALDRARLDAFSRDLERLGFERLLDTAPVTDSPRHTPSFCRVYAHQGQRCFAVLMQSFPKLGASLELRCMLNGYLDDGWLVGVGNGRPLPAAPFVRRPRAIGISRPGAPVEELMARFLRFRDQVTADLGVRPIADTSLAFFQSRTSESQREILRAMKRKSVTVGLGQYYSRKLGLGSEASQLVWLGDYPRLADERKAAGLGPGFSGTAVLE